MPVQATTEPLVEEHFERVHRYVRMRVPPRDVDDVVAEVFLRAVERGRERRSDRAGPWLFSIARSRVADSYRRREADVSLDTLDSVEHARRPQEPTTPLEKLVREEFVALLRRKLRELTDVEPSSVDIGDELEMTFRRLYTGQGVHNYFWKARPRR